MNKEEEDDLRDRVAKAATLSEKAQVVMEVLHPARTPEEEENELWMLSARAIGKSEKFIRQIYEEPPYRKPLNRAERRKQKP